MHNLCRKEPLTLLACLSLPGAACCCAAVRPSAAVRSMRAVKTRSQRPTEAALLKARLHLRREAVVTVDAQIKEAADALRLLCRAPATSTGAADSENRCGSPGRQDTGGLSDHACAQRPERSMPCPP